MSPVQEVENLRVNLEVVEMEHSHTGVKRMSDDYGRCTTLLRSIDDGRVLQSLNESPKTSTTFNPVLKKTYFTGLDFLV